MPRWLSRGTSFFLLDSDAVMRSLLREMEEKKKNNKKSLKKGDKKKKRIYFMYDVRSPRPSNIQRNTNNTYTPARETARVPRAREFIHGRARGMCTHCQRENCHSWYSCVYCNISRQSWTRPSIVLSFILSDISHIPVTYYFNAYKYLYRVCMHNLISFCRHIFPHPSIGEIGARRSSGAMRVARQNIDF